MESALAGKAKIKSVYKTNYAKNPFRNMVGIKVEQKKIQRQAKRRLRALRMANGMYAEDGMIKPKTTVLFETVKGRNLHNHPFFHGVPHQCLRSFRMGLVCRMKAIESTFATVLLESDMAWHRYGANGGVNLGISVTDGGTHAKGGYSGSIHSAKALKGNPRLRETLYDLIRSILEDAYGDQLWYRRSVHLCNKLNKDSGEERTIPGTPLSGIWFSSIPREESVHCDRNIAGPIFVLSNFKAKPGTGALCCMSKEGILTKCTLQPGIIMGGTWGSDPHCNLNFDDKAKATRTSMTLYLDKRVFGANYKFVCPNGFESV